jgi:hypothetical protein
MALVILPFGQCDSSSVQEASVRAQMNVKESRTPPVRTMLVNRDLGKRARGDILPWLQMESAKRGAKQNDCDSDVLGDTRFSKSSLSKVENTVYSVIQTVE